jgi:CDP-diacylglycerol---serine O-phosphatidyltransferase
MIENKKEFKLIPKKKTPTSLLPNALTILGVCLGLSSIKFALDFNYEMAVITIGFAAILDTLDGRVARLVNATSKVGKELDSLTDVISFGVAPSFIMYFWSINEIGKFGWLFVLVYTVCCALRLARFNLTNIEDSEVWKINFFEGVPSPAAAGLVLLPLILSLSNIVEVLNLETIISFLNFNNIFTAGNTKIASSIIIISTSILMVSKIPTYSLKRISIPRKSGGFLLLGIGTYISLLIFFTFEVLFFTGLIYILLIPVSYFHHKHLSKKFSNENNDEEEIEDIL